MVKGENTMIDIEINFDGWSEGFDPDLYLEGDSWYVYQLECFVNMCNIPRANSFLIDRFSIKFDKAKWIYYEYACLSHLLILEKQISAIKMEVPKIVIERIEFEKSDPSREHKPYWEKCK